MRAPCWYILMPEKLHDDEMTSIHLVMTYIALITGIMCSAIMIMGLLNAAPLMAFASSLGMISSLILHVLSQRGYLTGARIILPLLTFVLATFLCMSYGGIHDEAILLYPLTLVLASLLLGKRGIMLFALLTLAAVLVIGLAQINGRIGMPFNAQITYASVFLVEALIVFMAALLYFTISRLLNSVERARRVSRQLQQELTQRQQAEAALQASEERFRALAENSLDTIMRFDRAHQHLYANPVVETFTGLPASAFPGKTHAELGFPPELVTLWDKAIDTVFASGKPYRLEFELPSHVWLDWLVIPEFAPDGSVQTVLTSARDITALKHAEEALRKSEEYYRNLVNILPDALTIIDMNGRLTFISPQAYRRHGVSADANLLGSSVFNWFEPVEHPRVQELLQRLAAGQAMPVAEYRMHTYNGGSIWIELASTPLTDAQGQVTGIMSISRDITDRKRAEEALRQAKEAAEFANLAKTNFLRSVSHELRTPLNHILGFAQMLDSQQGGALNSQQAQLANDIVSGGEHLLRLIDDILTLSQLDFGTGSLFLQAIPLKPLLENSLRHIREKDLKQRLALSIKLPPELAGTTLMADQRKLKQILFQLLSNAVKFTPDGGEIVLDAAYRESDVVISVRDTGIGIAPDDQPKIFEPFYQVQGGLVNKTPGTGLGLAIVRRLVELHGGSVWVTSAGLGQGSCFSVSFPQCDALQAGEQAVPATNCHEMLSAEPPNEQPPAAEGFVLNAAAMNSLPADVQASLRDAADTADMEMAQAIIRRIRPLNAPLADALAELVDKYRFDTLLALFTNERGEEGVAGS